ncbi:hypothetical protein Tco_0725633 [Tanacetum coccineum]|uniref:Uncharacterized protein n=1 Tax=Tanacetum coccineum TaxID=301880 RepID=A0ABQ4YE94_9ASTR
MSSDSASSEQAAPASPDYVPGPEDPEKPPSPDYVPGLEYPEYLALADDKIVAEDKPYADYVSPTALSPGYVADSDPEEDPKEDPEEDPKIGFFFSKGGFFFLDILADGGDDDDDDDSSDDDEEKEEASEEEEDEHLAPADSVIAPTVDFVPSFEEGKKTAPMPFPSEEEFERLFALPPPPPLISLSPPSEEERLARCLATPALPSSPLPKVPHSYGSPNHVRAPPGFRDAMDRLRVSSPSTHHLLHP